MPTLGVGDGSQRWCSTQRCPDFVYLLREMVDTLDTRAARARILRMKEVAPSGVLELEGLDARAVRVHMDRCAPHVIGWT
jgi:hypothetical protein